MTNTKSSEQELWFWTLINQSRQSNDTDEHIENLTKLLTKLDKEQLIAFEQILQKKLFELDSAEIAELAIILDSSLEEINGEYQVDGFLSDDSFLYFRCWLILKGKQFFDDIKADIQSFMNGNENFDPDELWAENLLYVTDSAFIRTNKECGNTPIRDAIFEITNGFNYDFSSNMQREIMDDEEILHAYPKLIKAISLLKNTS